MGELGAKALDETAHFCAAAAGVDAESGAALTAVRVGVDGARPRIYVFQL